MYQSLKVHFGSIHNSKFSILNSFFMYKLLKKANCDIDSYIRMNQEFYKYNKEG